MHGLPLRGKMKMTIYAHTARDGGEWEPLPAHLAGTAALCGRFLEPIGQARTGELLGYMHDLGKADAMFQEVLRGERQRVNHALAGAAVMAGSTRSGRAARVMSTVIACHHGGLKDGAADQAKALYTKGLERDELDRDVALGSRERLKAALQWLREELPEARFQANPLPPERAGDGNFEASLSEMLLTRWLYSALVDADWSATAALDPANDSDAFDDVALDASAALARLKAVREEKRRAAQSANGGVSELNRLRDALFDRCLSAGGGASGLYTLTAPTGMGKTLALMAFALRHCQAHGKRRVIVLLPWLSLAEQNTAEYRRVFPEPGALLEIHSAAGAETPEAETGDMAFRERLRALVERWNAPCVVTTVVGFFESLFSDQARACRHIHQLADSVVILDEAQSLPHHLLRSTLLCVRELVERFRCTVLFSTATQPAFARLPGMAGLWKPVEIVPDPQMLADRTRRVVYRWRLGEDSLTREALEQSLLDAPQALLIVNTRAVAQSIYGALRDAGREDAFLLSADLCMAHRREVLAGVRDRLAEGRPCLLVSTSCIEAGVDVSFPVLYRQLAPLESVIQAAGRCNRNGHAPDGIVTVFEFDDERCNRFPGTHYERCAKALKALRTEYPELDPCALRWIEAYDVRVFRDMQDDAKLTEAICKLDYPGTRQAYRMIDEYGVNLIVPYDAGAFSRLRAMADAEGLTPTLARLARPYAVNVPFRRVADAACPIPVLGRNARAESGWYLLGDPARYDIQGGFGLLNADDSGSDGLLCG